MRVIMWIGIGFAASCGACVYVLPQSWLLPAVIAASIMVAVCLLCALRWKAFRIPLVLLLGVLGGFLRYDHFHTSRILPAQAVNRQTLEAELTAQDFSYETPYGYAVDARMELDGIFQNVRVYLDEDYALEPGTEFSGSFRFRFAEPKSGERTSYLQSNGILLIANQRGELRVLGDSHDQWRYFPAKLANLIKGILKLAFPEDVYPFVKAVLLGDTSEISYEVDSALKISGIRHVVAVSGLHVSILYGILQVITGRKRFLTALIGLPVLLLFAAVAGFTPSVTRACLMAALMMLSQLIQKEYDGPTSLSFACLMMLISDPLAIGSVSLQLSAGCVAGIMLFQTRIKNLLDKWIHNVERDEKTRFKSWISSSVAVTLGAMSLTTPLCAFYFGVVSIVGVVTNLLTLWVLNIVFIGIVITCVIGAVSIPVASVIGWVLAWPIRYVLYTADFLSELPFAAVYTQSVFIVVWLIFTYGLLCLYLCVGKRPRLVVSLILLGLCVALCCSWLEPMLYGCVVTVMDVGQGQSILIQTEGKNILVDCGGDYGESAADKVSQKLFSVGVSRLDAIILTHGDVDHSGGLEYLLTRVETDLLLHGMEEADFLYLPPSTEVYTVESFTKLAFGDAVVTVYPPVFLSDDNENSLCILFDTEKCDILVTGDRSQFGERLLLSQYGVADVDILVAGHHGSKNSTGEELLAATCPETVVISAGKDNIFGHPAQELLDRLEAFGCNVRRTDLEGTIVIRR